MISTSLGKVIVIQKCHTLWRKKYIFPAKVYLNVLIASQEWKQQQYGL